MLPLRAHLCLVPSLSIFPAAIQPPKSQLLANKRTMARREKEGPLSVEKRDKWTNEASLFWPRPQIAIIVPQNYRGVNIPDF